jgi:hypothetical protein
MREDGRFISCFPIWFEGFAVITLAFAIAGILTSSIWRNEMQTVFGR